MGKLNYVIIAIIVFASVILLNYFSSSGVVPNKQPDYAVNSVKGAFHNNINGADDVLRHRTSHYVTDGVRALWVEIRNEKIYKISSMVLGESGGVDPAEDAEKTSEAIASRPIEEKYKCGTVQNSLVNVVNNTESEVITDQQFNEIIKKCDALKITPRTKIRLDKGGMFPGTKWCGVGNTADSDDDLGTSPATDSCCRSHDKCPDIIPAMTLKNGLRNMWIATRLHCHCENAFFDCLKAVPDETSARLIGVFYFDHLVPKCFVDYHPTICVSKGSNGDCTEERVDNSTTLYKYGPEWTRKFNS